MPLRSVRFRILFATACAAATSLLAADQSPYIGEWSNGHGDTLVITAKTMRFAEDKPVPYRDVTRSTDGKTFALEITAPGEVNFFAEKFLAIECGDDEIRMVGYKSQADLLHGEHQGSDVVWYKEDDRVDD